ncbi:MAG: nicotinate-nucleotide adenylyltransferase [Gammaproteobacteria bacterium]|nr:nicotinate-nucleotide adenylyltransferase [Gammaproteobacteria bacterium]MBU1656401.1 nicotinate-nucleotide adenylyltransferase [Gammaproteobacteria bacterium]MBU1960949.1 nicotinate-nucleotide adenylyltransferase [Gammaproteobacteria bacterium]
MIGIYGGTFDPIHYGHLRSALEVMEALGLEEVRFLPLRQAVHRQQPHASAPQRLAMVQAALTGQPEFRADETELGRTGPSYMIDSLQHLRETLPGQTLCLLLGSDAFNSFMDWRQPEEIADLCHIVVMQRPGYWLPEEPRLRALVQERNTQSLGALLNATGGQIYFQPVTQLDISATDIRRRVVNAQSPRYLLPDSVIRIIREQNLYAGYH